MRHRDRLPVSMFALGLGAMGLLLCAIGAGITLLWDLHMPGIPVAILGTILLLTQIPFAYLLKQSQMNV